MENRLFFAGHGEAHFDIRPRWPLFRFVLTLKSASTNRPLTQERDSEPLFNLISVILLARDQIDQLTIRAELVKK